MFISFLENSIYFSGILFFLGISRYIFPEKISRILNISFIALLNIRHIHIVYTTVSVYENAQGQCTRKIQIDPLFRLLIE